VGNVLFVLVGYKLDPVEVLPNVDVDGVLPSSLVFDYDHPNVVKRFISFRQLILPKGFGLSSRW